MGIIKPETAPRFARKPSSSPSTEGSPLPAAMEAQHLVRQTINMTTPMATPE
eukprot:CAMPEP_0117562600 /NCGR_PEP_ID=MMETSP0784-20121206/55041_1 /TAXON_ID=39447 /ORGANISM="" /LENGTH=51 /DNA_ID=CAMNT_0005360177 /DNA_START=52 /DNA_END=207 /DNA_ORIENTATION=-